MNNYNSTSKLNKSNQDKKHIDKQDNVEKVFDMLLEDSNMCDKLEKILQEKKTKKESKKTYSEMIELEDVDFSSLNNPSDTLSESIYIKKEGGYDVKYKKSSNNCGDFIIIDDISESNSFNKETSDNIDEQQNYYYCDKVGKYIKKGVALWGAAGVVIGVGKWFGLGLL